MQSNGPLDVLPLWGLFIVILLVVLLSVEFGYRLGKYRRSRSEQEKEAPVGTMVGATLVCLRLFLRSPLGWRLHALMPGGRYCLTRQTQLARRTCAQASFPSEANKFEHFSETTWTLAWKLFGRATSRREYGGRRTFNNNSGPKRSLSGGKNPNSIVVGLFVQSLNEVIDLHAKRVQAGLRSRIPGAIWLGLFAVAALSLAAMGYQAGLVATRRSLAVFAVAVTFSVVIELIADLDRPQQGVLRVSQHALLDLQRSMNSQ